MTVSEDKHQNIVSAKRKIFWYWFRTVNTQNMSYSINLYHSVSLSPSTKSVPTSSSRSWHPPALFTAIHCNGYTALLIKPFTVTAGEMHCHALMFRLQRRVTLCFLILQSGVKAWSPFKIQSLNSFFRSYFNTVVTIILCSQNNW